MSFTIPDKGEGQNDIQSILFQEALEVLVAGIDGVDCVLSGGAVTPNALLVLNVAKTAVLTNGVLKAVAAATVAVAAVDVTNPRIDYVVVNSAGALAVRTGTAAATPKPPNRTANDVVLAQVYVPANDVTIDAAQITDRRVFRTVGPITVYKDSTSVATNTTAAAVTVFSLVLPSGLLLAGKSLHVRCGGNYLHNSATPTLTLTISYGGTTMYAGTTIASTNSANRTSWCLTFDLVAQANNDQHLSGVFLHQPGAPTLPATGLGPMGGQTAAAPNGASAVDSDAADRTLLVTLTMSVSNAANEIVKEYGGATIQ